MTSNSEETKSDDVLRSYVKRGIARIAISAGYESANNDALETLVELYSAFLYSIAESTKNFTELGSRTQPMIQDVIGATTELGINLDDDVRNAIAAQRNSSSSFTIDTVTEAKIPEKVAVKNIDERKVHAPCVYDFMPEYPEPHTYITSPAICRNAIRSEFDEVKQIAVDNIRDSQSALAKFSAKMETKLHGNEGTINLIPNDEATCVVTPSGSEMHECKVINVGDEQEWHVQAKIPPISENATIDQINQNPYIRPPKRR